MGTERIGSDSPGRRIPLVYILSNGRSGSTILDMLLGAHPAVWTMGEVQLMPLDAAHNIQPCGCGRSVATCSFWSLFASKVQNSESKFPVEYFRLPNRAGKVLRGNLLQDLWRSRISRRWLSAVAEYGSENYKLISLVKQKAAERRSGDIRWLIDASKDAYRLFWLAESRLFDIRVIHLVKDSRAFVYSMVCKNEAASWSRILRYSARWCVENLIAARVCNNGFPSNHVKLVRYENLAENPKETMSEIFQWLDLDDAGDFMSGFRENENHGISGNASRLETKPFTLDEKWKHNMPAAQAWFVRVSTLPIMRHFGYN